MNFSVWLLQTRPQFLLLSLVLVFLGTSIAWYDRQFNISHAILAFVGLTLAHISVNTFNDYFYYRRTSDVEAIRTPFRGVSDTLPAGRLTQKQILSLGTGSLLLAMPIGIYFLVSYGWVLLPLLLLAFITVIAYTPVFVKSPWPELIAGLGLGALPVLGVYFVQTGEYTLPILIACIPSAILVHNLLLLNEFPDVETDSRIDRKTLPVMLGKKKAGAVYSTLAVVMYLWIIGGVISGQMPVLALVALLTAPWAFRAIKGALNPNDMNLLAPALSANIMLVLVTQLLLGTGFIMAVIF